MFELTEQHPRNTYAHKYWMQNLISLQHKTHCISKLSAMIFFLPMEKEYLISTCFKHGFDKGVISNGIKFQVFFKASVDNTFCFLMFSCGIFMLMIISSQYYLNVVAYQLNNQSRNIQSSSYSLVL